MYRNLYRFNTDKDVLGCALMMALNRVQWGEKNFEKDESHVKKYNIYTMPYFVMELLKTNVLKTFKVFWGNVSYLTQVKLHINTDSVPLLGKGKEVSNIKKRLLGEHLD